MCEFETINDFVKRYNCGLEVMDEGEHYFHTEEQLNVFKHWLQKHIDSTFSNLVAKASK